MPHLSVVIPDYLQEKILAKGKQMGIDNMSEIVRILLLSATENVNHVIQDTESKRLYDHAAHYAILDHYLLEECLFALVEGGAGMKDRAYAKAEKFLTAILQETSP